MEPHVYLPTGLVSLVDARAGTAAEVPVEVSASGALLFVDISGFTTLTERLGQDRGADGIDQLARVIHEKFGLLAARVQAWGGEVVAFAGDAVTAWWPADEGALDGAVGCAAACSREIEGDFVAPIEGIPVQVRQVISVGALRVIRLGEAPHHVVVDGPALLAVEEGAGRPAGGPAWLTAAARARLPTVRSERPPPRPSMALSPDYVDPRITAWIAATAREPQLRVVTVVFVRVGAVDTIRMHRALAAAREVLASRRGAVVELSRDDKGLVLVAAFGLPGLPAPGPADAVAAAVAIVEAWSDLGAGAGVASGRLSFGAPPVGERRRVALLGSAMNLAARLMMLGPGVWVAPAVARAAAAEVEVAGPRSVRFKGFAQPISVWTATGAARADALFGRASFLAQLLAEVEAGPGLVGLGGGAGLGKSAVLRALARALTAKGVFAVRLAGTGTDRPFGPWSAALRARFRAHDDEALVDRLRDRLGADGPLLPLLGPALGLRLPESTATAELSLAARGSRATELLATALLPSWEARRVFLVDDADALDERSADAVHELVARGATVVMARRDTAPGPRRLVLAPLDVEATAAFVAERLGSSAALPEGLLDWVMDRSGGNPQFIAELLASAQERGFLELEPRRGTWYFDRAGLDAAELPDSIQAVLAARLDGLPAEAAELLRAASVIGPLVDRAALAALVPGATEATLTPLLDGGWLHAHRGGLRFESRSAQLAVHNQLAQGVRRRLHGAILRWLRPPDDVHAHAAHAEHLAQAGEFPAALDALSGAFGLAVTAGLPRLASTLARRALAVDDEAASAGQPRLDGLARAHWHLRAAEACRGFGDTDGAALQLTLAADRAVLVLPAAAHTSALHALGQLLLHLGERLLPRRRAPGDALRASVLNMAALLAFLQGAPPAVLLATAAKAVRLGWRRGEGEAPNTALASSLLAGAFLQFPRIARRYAAEGARRAAPSTPQERTDAALGQLLVHLAYMEWSAAELCHMRIRRDLELGRHDTLHAGILGLLAVVDAFSGRLARSAERAAAMLQLAERHGYLQARAWAQNIQATLALYAHEPAAARRIADEAEAIFGRRRELNRHTPLAIRARALLQEGDVDGAVREVERLQAALVGEALSVTEIETASAPAEVYLLAARARPELATRADAALRTFSTYAAPFPLGRVRLQVLRAGRDHLRGHLDARSLRHAHEQARALPVEALLLADLTGDPAPELRARMAEGWARVVALDGVRAPIPDG